MGDMIQAGDILVFKAGEHWLSKSIALLTNSDVSHAAMVYNGETIVEMELPGIQLTRFMAREGDTAYLMRLNPELDPGPLVDAAKGYVNAKTRYDIPGLVILGGLLIYRTIRPTPEFVLIADLILRAASRAMDGLIQSVILHNPDKAMVCSQLVYQIYNDCRNEYHIHLEGGTFQTDGNENAIQSQADTVRLIDSIAAAATEVANAHGYPEEDPEELARRLCGVLQEQDNHSDVIEEPLAAARPLLNPAKRLLEQLEEFLEKTKAGIPIDALFVTPADLVYHAKNLRLVKTVEIVKDLT